MGFDQYHEPADELPEETRTFARLCASLTEEAEAIGWYEQRLSVEPDPQARGIMRDAQGEEFKHFSMDLEFLLRRTPKEPLDEFRRYMAVYAREQAECHFSPALIRNLEKHWDAANRRG